MVFDLLSEEQYRSLKKIGKFDSKTSSWLKKSAEIWKLGGAFIAEFRYKNVFVYHKSSESYYAKRGFRVSNKVWS